MTIYQTPQGQGTTNPLQAFVLAELAKKVVTLPVLKVEEENA